MKSRTGLLALTTLLLTVVMLKGAEGDARFFEERLRAAFGGMEALAQSCSGLPADIGMVMGEEVAVKDSKTSPTNIALWIVSLIVARDRGYLPPAEVERHLTQVVATLLKMEKYEGFFYNWYDLSRLTDQGAPRAGSPTVGPEAQRFISSVDNANLTAAMMVAQAAFLGSSFAADLAELIQRQDYGLFFRRDWRGWPRLSHGYRVDKEEFSPFDYGTFLTEARLLVLLTILKGDVPDYPWCTTVSPGGIGGEAYMEASSTRCCPGRAGSELTLMASWGGSLFEELFPDLFLDEFRLSPALAENHRRAVQCQMAQADPVTGLWGWSPSESVVGAYKEAGVPCIGSGGQYPIGDVSFYSVALATPYAVTEARAALEKAEALNADVWSPRFGYRDSISRDGTSICPDILALDKGIEVAALFNVVQGLEDRQKLSGYLWDYLDRRGVGARGRALLAGVNFPIFSTGGGSAPETMLENEPLSIGAALSYCSIGTGRSGKAEAQIAALQSGLRRRECSDVF